MEASQAIAEAVFAEVIDAESIVADVIDAGDGIQDVIFVAISGIALDAATIDQTRIVDGDGVIGETDLAVGSEPSEGRNADAR